jgi:Flp pilus assembly protein TadG
MRIAAFLRRPTRGAPGRRPTFASDDRGATAIEFALVATPFFGIVLLILQIGLYHFSLQSFDFAVRQAGRVVMTGRVDPAALTASTFKTTYICPKVFFTIACDKVVLNSFKVGKVSDSKTSSGVYAHIDAVQRRLRDPATTPATQSFCLGGPGDYVYIDAAYPFPNFVKKLLSADAGQTWLLRSSTVIFNEPKINNGSATC